MSLAAEILRSIDREIWVVTAAEGEKEGGLVSTTVASASIVAEMPRVLITLSHRHFTSGLITRTGRFALHLLDREQTSLAFRFGGQSGRDVDKLAGLPMERTPSGLPVLSESVAWLECRVEARVDIGDRDVVLAEVVSSHRNRSSPPLTVQHWMSVAKEEERRMLRKLLDEDAVADAAAIAAWRESRNA